MVRADAVERHDRQICGEMFRGCQGDGQGSEGNETCRQSFLPVSKASPRAHEETSGHHAGKSGQLRGGEVPVGFAEGPADEKASQITARDAEEGEQAVDKQQPSGHTVGKCVVYAGFHIGEERG